MSSKTSELFDAFDLADLRFFLLIAKKNLKFILLASVLVSMIIYFISLNIEKKYLSEATIVIEPDENKIVNINEAYSTINTGTRVNNLIAILESDEVIMGVRPNQVSVSAKKSANNFPAEVYARQLLGGELLIEVDIEGIKVRSRVSLDTPLQIGDNCHVSMEVETCNLFSPHSGAALF